MSWYTHTRSAGGARRGPTTTIALIVAATLLATSIEVIATSGAASAAPVNIDPREVAVLSGTVADAERAPAKPVGDFTPLAKFDTGSQFDPQRSKVVSRSMFADEYENPDGTHTVRQSTAPLNAQDASGTWGPVDSGLEVDGRSKRATAKRHPLSPSLAGKANDSAVLSVQAGEHKVSLAMDEAAATTAEVDGDKVSYADVAPDTDLDYEITSGQVKETIKLKKAPAADKSSWRFRLDAGGLTPMVDPAGAVLLTDSSDAVKLVIPPVETWDSAGGADGAPALTGGTYALERAGDAWWLTVAVDAAWLHDPARVYPVSVDPSFTFGIDESHTFRSDGSRCDNCGLRVGNSLSAGDSYNRSWFHVDYSSLFGKTVVGARLDVSREPGTTGSIKTWSSGLHHAIDQSINGLGENLGTALVGDVGSFSGTALTNFLRGRVDARDTRAAFIMTGTEQPGTWTYKHLNATLLVDTGTAAPAPALASPADGSVLTSLTPTLAVNPVTDPDGEQVTYCFKVATGADAQSGVVVDSGCLPTSSWSVPPGVLQDGVSYTWRASAHSGSTMVTPSWIGHLKVDQRIGDRGPSPVDTLGPVTVNLANGNVSLSEATPTFTAVGGNAGLTFGYNSQQREPKGLRAFYYNDLSHNGIINPSQQPVLTRTEPQVNVDYGSESPFAPALPADYFFVRWEGFFQAPAAGSYQFAGVHDDGAEVFVNGAKVYDGDGVSDVNWTQATGVALTAGQRVSIKVELQEITGASRMRLFTRTADGTTVPAQIVPADWLFSSDLPALSQGWTLSSDLDGSGASYTTAQVTDQNVVLTDATGAKHTYTKKSAGGYTAPEGEDGVLGLDTGGLVTLQEGGSVFSFRADGKLDTQSSVADSRKPAALQNVYDGGTPSRLVQIKDAVSGRAHVLHYNRAGDDCYAGATPPPGVDAAPPAQMLCRVSYWDGAETRLWYYTGKLYRIEDPGSEVTDYGYTPDGVLDRVRTSLVNDWIAADPATRGVNVDVLANITYDTSSGKPKATGVTAPAPKLGQPRPAHTYRYDPAARQTFVDTAGATPAIGFTSKVVYDDADRLLSTTDATGRATSQTWSVKDQALSATDSAGRVSTTVYDHADREVDKYGPAPASCFTGQVPTADCANTVPRTHTGYDEGVNGLAVSLYDNTTLSGAPKVYRTGVGTADGSLAGAWGEGLGRPMNLPNDVFTARFTGEVVFPAAGEYTLRALVDDGIRMWLDDSLVIDDWRSTSPAWREAKTTSAAPGTVKRVRIDYLNQETASKIELHWTTPAGVQELVPGSALRPRYGLSTSTTDFESDGVSDKVSAVRYNGGIDPSYGLASSGVSDPNGLKLAKSTEYESVGTGYLRTTSKSKPTGAKTTNTYYGDAETRANPCVAGSPAVNQGGLTKLVTSTAPASGGARTDEQVFDASGRVVAKGTTGDWECTTYDVRDREITKTSPANSTSGARTVTITYGANGDPLATSVSDSAGTVVTAVDLLGRVVAYTDVQGTRTETTYDQAGRVSGTRVVPPNPADAAMTSTVTYDDAGRPLVTKLGSTVLATSTYDAEGELDTVTYSNGTKLLATGKDAAGRTTSLTWGTADGKQVVASVGRTRAGTIVDEALGGVDSRPGAPNFVYDGVGRMTEAYVAGHHYTYDFTSSAPAGCPTGTQANAGLNTNRVRLLDQTASGTAETGYCYDAADRLLGSTGVGAVTDVTYDKHGNTTGFTSGGATTTLGFDGADRNVRASTASTDPTKVAAVGYVRDATDRIVRRDVTAGDQTTAVLYGYTGSGDAGDLTLTADKKLVSLSLGLPGGVLYTAPAAGQATWDHPSVHGDIVLTTDTAGRQAGDLRRYSPFGEPLNAAGASDPQNVPDNQPGKMDYGWLGQHQREYEHAGALSLVQMGARPYSPMLGRFLTVDPVEGGSANDYDYVNGDPVNASDLDGTRARYVRYHRVYKKVRYKVRWVRHSRTTETEAQRKARIRGSLRIDIWSDWTSMVLGPRGSVSYACGLFPENHSIGQKCNAFDRHLGNAYKWGFDRLFDFGWAIGRRINSIGHRLQPVWRRSFFGW